MIVAAGTAVYAPFVRLSEHMQQERIRIDLEDLLRVFAEESELPALGNQFLERPLFSFPLF